ncbi:MAG: M64 family metallopeptidase [Bacteroidales bacterium]
MKKRYLLAIAICLTTSLLQAQVNFSEYFYNKCLRIDYTHSGNNQEEAYSVEKYWEEPYWAGSKKNLIDTFEYGKYFFKVFDKASNTEIYSRGFCSLFGEWQTTAEAKKIRKAFNESIIMPYPKKDVYIIFYTRDFHSGKWIKKSEFDIDVNSYFIKPNTQDQYPAFDVHISGEPSKKLDIVIIPEGYTQEELGRFTEDCKNFSDKLFSFAPYDKHKQNINIRGVWAPSAESGSAIPKERIYKNTILQSNFYTFDSERYCMVEDFQKVRNIAKNAPYDQIYILVNTDKYGGGGIYNFYSLSINGNIKAPEVFIHEFGHGFAGLGDEYYSSSTSYNDFYDLSIEPWEPNLTTLIDFDSKWKHLLKKSTPIPTPAKKKYLNRLGVFEGGGYISKGMYRPAYDCLMKSFQGHTFCAACQEAIEKMIAFYSE